MLCGPTKYFEKMLLAGSIFVCSALAPGAQGNDRPVAAQPTPAAPKSSPVSASAPIPASKSQRERDFYRKRWGIDDIAVRATASGILIRFSYRVLDAEKAALINDKTQTPYLIDEKTGIALVIPTMENVGLLRQTAAPVNGREYWMVFSNKGKFIKRGSRVDVMIGTFRIEGLVVE
jgi:hypothetical protein